MTLHVSRRRILATGGLAAALAAASPAWLAAQVKRREPEAQVAVTPADAGFGLIE
jgi:hypothetical protein